ncbi:hypothetical protein HI914_02532 [Erysiphe necator]|nr:hypothetical protein HI914_02532 [Erysiphe necator]
MIKQNFRSVLEVDSEDENDNLPYPEALLRSDFLTPRFEAIEYLSSLSDRHQTLEDLQSDLRERSQFLSKELLDLVNENYEQFLNLGSNLKDGEEQLENIRVGLLEFKSGVLDIRTKVKAKKDKIKCLLDEKKSISRQIIFGRKLLEVDARLDELEDGLTTMSLSQVTENSESHHRDDLHENYKKDENKTEIPISVISLENLFWFSRDICLIEALVAEIETDNPFISSQKARMTKSKNKILVNLGKALIQSKITEDNDNTRILKLLAIYRELGAAKKAIKILRELR